MNRLIKILFPAIICGMALQGCVYDDMGHCPPDVNAELTFSYTGDTGDPAMFREMIDRVTMFIFDAGGDLVLERTINKDALLIFQGTKLYLDPGYYHIVCWGNSFDNTEHADCHRKESGRVHNPQFSKGGKLPTEDHLYYGQYEVTVPESGKATGDIPFAGAHINIKVYINYALTGAHMEAPKVEAHNMMPQYDMEMAAVQPFATTYHPEVNYDSERKLHECFFQVFRFRDDNTAQIEIKGQDDKTAINIGLKDYMAENRITVDGLNEATVPILIEFTDLGVDISVPDWEEQWVTPES